MGKTKGVSMNWKEIKGYEGLYEVSDTGIVRGLLRETTLKPDVKHQSYTSYERVTLCKEGITKRFQVHQLVASAFIPNPLNLEYVNHIDSNGRNNHVSNLEWVTHSENMKHAFVYGNSKEQLTKNGFITGAKKLIETELKFKILLGDNFLKVDQEEGRTYIHYYCISCSNSTNGRSDRKHTKIGICARCSRKQKL